MKRTLALLGSLFLFAWAIGCSSSGPSSDGAKSTSAAPAASGAMNGAAIASAMQKATSWKMTMKSGTGETVMEVVCPDKMRTTTKTGAMTAEMIRVGNDMYSKAGSRWMKIPATGQPASVCGGAAGASQMPKLDANVKMTKGGTQTVNGETCTEWTTTVKGADGKETSSTMCVGSDNLPRQMKSGDAVMTFSDWNKPITIEAPKM
jgi:hypothetical protein